MKILYYIIFIVLFTCCCKQNAKKGIDITVIDESTKSAIADIQVYIRDINNKSTETLVDKGETDWNGHVHLKLNEQCGHYLKIGSGEMLNIIQEYIQEITYNTNIAEINYSATT